MHLLYSRFFGKALADLGVVHEREPFRRLFNQGQILGADGERMSKSRGNVQDPDELVARYGADTRPAVPHVHGPVGPGRPVELDRDRRDQPLPEPGLDGRRSTRRAPRPATPRRDACPRARPRPRPSGPCSSAAHRTVKVVTAEFEGYRFNTMVAHLMELTNVLMRYRGTEVAGGTAWNEAVRMLLLHAGPVRAAHRGGAVVADARIARRDVALHPPGAVAGARRSPGGRGRGGAAGPGQRQASRPRAGPGRPVGGRDRGDRAGAREGPDRPRREARRNAWCRCLAGWSTSSSGRRGAAARRAATPIARQPRPCRSSSRGSPHRAVRHGACTTRRPIDAGGGPARSAMLDMPIHP